jgi:hypothetical protein
MSYTKWPLCAMYQTVPLCHVMCHVGPLYHVSSGSPRAGVKWLPYVMCQVAALYYV